jgi:hypothetical protein
MQDATTKDLYGGVASPKKVIDLHPLQALFRMLCRRTGTLSNRNIMNVANIFSHSCVTVGSLGGLLAGRSYDELENDTPQRLGTDNLRR